MLIKIGSYKIDVHKCNYFEKIVGLMFSKKENSKILLFEFQKPTKIAIHSMFVFFPFVAIWLDSDDKVIDLQIVNPWRFSVKTKEKFVKLIEIPVNRRYSDIIKLLDGDT